MHLRHAALAIICAAHGLYASPSLAEPWPQKTVRLIVPVPPGGGTDLAARLFAERLSERWQHPVIVENRQGAEGIIAVSAFVNSRDNHTLLFSFAGPITIAPLLQQKLPYDPARDLVPIAAAVDNFFAIAVSETLGTKTLDDFVELARSQPRTFNWAATPGLPQFIFAALQKSAGLDLVQVSYREFAPALQDLGTGRIHAVATGLPLLKPLADTGKVRLVMVTNRERSPLVPHVPTAKEAGYPELLFEGVVGFYGWRDMPSDLKERIAADVRTVAADPALGAKLAAVGIIVRAGSAAEFAAAIEDQRVKVAAMIRQ
jgi:tripartite-type tricarboxylate transporter receptor subunit TctC